MAPFSQCIWNISKKEAQRTLPNGLRYPLVISTGSIRRGGITPL
jgi:hypothetical protein